jgi:hypothetical protein
MSQDKIIDTSDIAKYEDKLKAFTPPKMGKDKIPYVLFGGWQMSYKPDNGSYKQEIEYDLRCMQYPDSAPSVDVINYYKNKGWTLIDYYFPHKQDLTTRDQVSESGFKALIRTSEEDMYREARAFCNSLKNAAHNINAQQKEISALKQELENVRGKAKSNSASKSVEASASKLES